MRSAPEEGLRVGPGGLGWTEDPRDGGQGREAQDPGWPQGEVWRAGPVCSLRTHPSKLGGGSAGGGRGFLQGGPSSPALLQRELPPDLPGYPHALCQRQQRGDAGPCLVQRPWAGAAS